MTLNNAADNRIEMSRNLRIVKDSTNVSFFMFRNQIVADDTTITSLIMRGLTDTSVEVAYVKLSGIVESDVNASFQGSFYIAVAENGVSNVRYIHFNDAALGQISLLKDTNITAAKKFFLDGTGAGAGSDTSIRESSANIITFEQGGFDVSLPAVSAVDTITLLGLAQTLANKTLTTPIIASFINSIHDHSNAAGGGILLDAAIPDLLQLRFVNTTDIAYLGTATVFVTSGVARREIWIKKIDANNEGVFTKIFKNGAAVEVQIA